MTELASRSAQLAERLAAFCLNDIPPEVVCHARLILLDTLGAMLAASNQKYSATRILADLARRPSGRPLTRPANESAKDRPQGRPSVGPDACPEKPAGCRARRRVPPPSLPRRNPVRVQPVRDRVVAPPPPPLPADSL